MPNDKNMIVSLLIRTYKGNRNVNQQIREDNPGKTIKRL